MMTEKDQFIYDSLANGESKILSTETDDKSLMLSNGIR